MSAMDIARFPVYRKEIRYQQKGSVDKGLDVRGEGEVKAVGHILSDISGSLARL